MAFELRVADAFNAGRIRAPVHLSGGNEQQLIDYFAQHVRQQDWVCTTWRSHYHCLLKGVPEEVLFADILAGKSITLNYPEQRVLSSAIVGGICPIALGVAWAAKRRGLDERVHCFIGDMTARSGVVAECTQYAAWHALPLCFVIENNGVSVCTPTNDAWGKEAEPNVYSYDYTLSWPHSGAGKRVEF